MERQYSIKEIIQITQVTKRTLHYYDEIGLLVPKKNVENGYRQYSQKDLISLQKILLLRKLGIELKDIQQLIKDSNHDLRENLIPYHQKLVDKITDLMIVEENLADFLQGKPLTELPLFHTNIQQQFNEEARIKYGNTEEYQSFLKKQLNHSFDFTKQDSPDWLKIKEIFSHFNQVTKLEINSKEVRRCVEMWKDFLLTYGNFSNSVLCYIAKSYEYDPRFHEYFEKYWSKELPDFIYQAASYHLKE